jgi:signal transduction histidine kinase
LCLVCLGNPISQAAEISVTQQQLPVMLGQYLVYLEDSDRQLSIEDFLRGDADFGWQRNTQDIPTLGISNAAHWFRITMNLQALAAASQATALLVNSPVIDSLEIFFLQQGALVKSVKLGDTVPMSRLELPLRVPIVLFDGIDLNTAVDVYFRVTSSTGVELPLSISSLGQLLVEQQWSMAYQGALFTFLIVCVLSSALIYAYLRMPIFLNACLFFTGAILFFLGSTGMGRVWLWPESTSLNTRLVLFAGTLLVLGFSLIGQTIELKFRHQDSVRLVLRVLAFGMFPAALYYLLIPFDKLAAENILPLMWLGLAVALLVMLMAGMAAAKGSRTALFLCSSWVLLLLSYMITLLYKFQITQRSDFMTSVSYGLFVTSTIVLLLTLSSFIRNKAQEVQLARRDAAEKNDFLRKVSREILTPVHLVLANSKRLLKLDDRIDDAARPQLTTIIKQSNYLHQLINDLLEMAELESDSFAPHWELVEMTRFLSQIHDAMKRQAEEKGLTLATQFSSANLLVQTDKARLQHAINNLITNAIKFTDAGTITLGYKAIYFQRRLGIEISVKDTGRGMSEAFRQQVFREFSREKPGSETSPEGTGLSLAIVKRMVEKLGGEIDFETRLNKGTEFFIRLPLRASTA